MHGYHLKMAGLFFVLLSIGFVVYIFSAPNKTRLNTVNDFDSCVQAGGMVLEKYPAECRLPDGSSFTELIDEEKNPTGVSPAMESDCQKVGGVYNAEMVECQGVSKNSCESIGGTFDECASPCRNDPSAEVCILMCEQTCLLN